MRLTAAIAGLLMFALFLVNDSPTVHAQTTTKEENQPKTVIIQPGDTLTKVAAENSTTYPRLFDANPQIADPDVISVGEKVRIPSPDEVLASRIQSTNQPPASPQAAASAPAPANAPSGGVWDQLAQCESGGNWAINTGNGYYGGLQFSLSSWQAVGGSGLPSNASKAEQIARGEMLQARQGWGAWPSCTAKLGIR